MKRIVMVLAAAALPACSITLDPADGFRCDGPSQCDDGYRCVQGKCTKAGPTCGDFVVDPGEECDDGNAVTEACAYGQTACTVCDSSCKLVAGAVSYCGDNRTDSAHGESCDDGNTVTESCDYGQTTCTVCGADCTTTTGAMSFCGDGHWDISDGEECDDGNNVTEACAYGEKSCPPVCDASCKLVDGATSYCGDNRKDTANGETCDDGNAVTEKCAYNATSCTVCDASCHEVAGATMRCGDGHPDPEGAEECDDGVNSGVCPAATPNCTPCGPACKWVPTFYVFGTTATAAAGFGKQATLTVVVQGGTPPYAYSWSVKDSNPTTVSVSDPSAASPTFTTGTVSDIVTAGTVEGLSAAVGVVTDGTYSATRSGWVAVSAQQSASLTYSFIVTVTDHNGWVKSATISVPAATVSRGGGTVALGETIIAALPGNTYASLTPPGGAAVALNDAASTYPWFVPTVEGTYTLVGSDGTTLSVVAASHVGADNCTGCHSAATIAEVAAKSSAWRLSLHGNHFARYMQYDVNGNLSWKPGTAWLPTANPYVSWSVASMPTSGGYPVAMPLFRFGMSGGEGNHYGTGCMTCHTTGYDTLASNGGADDAAAAASWTPYLAFDGLTDGGDVNQTPVTPAQSSQYWDAMPASLRALAGVQCESCHGPLGRHVSTSGAAGTAPAPEYDVGACAVCHDKVSNHDRVALWRQSAHSDAAVAIARANSTQASNCGRCHTAQGFVRYLAQLEGRVVNDAGATLTAFPGLLLDPSSTNTVGVVASTTFLTSAGIDPAHAHPIGCTACHDPHTTELRLRDSAPTLASGFSVPYTGTGAPGSGALCMACHNSRNDAKSDALADQAAVNHYWRQNPLPGVNPPNASYYPTVLYGPHQGPQADVLYGKNAFWIDPSTNNHHAAITDTCVECHMRQLPLGATVKNTNHSFKTDTSNCSASSCHQNAHDPVEIQANFDTSAQALINAILARVRSHLAKGGPNNQFALAGWASGRTIVVDQTSTTVTIDSFLSGRVPTLRMSFNPAIEDPAHASGTVTTLDVALNYVFKASSGASTGEYAFDVLTGAVAKANWNYSLVAQDGSRGVHNAVWTFALLDATKQKVADNSLTP